MASTTIPRPATGQTFLDPPNAQRRGSGWAANSSDVVVIGGGVVLARRWPRRGPPGDCGSPWSRHATSRRAPPAAAPRCSTAGCATEQLEFGLVREALHERELSLSVLAPHLVAAALPVPADPTGPGSGPTWRESSSTTSWRGEIGSGATASDPLAHAVAPAQAQLADRRHPLLRHRGRRRPAHHDRRSHRGALRRVVRTLHPGGGHAATEGDRVVGVGPGPETGASPRCGHVVINATGCGPTRSRFCPSSAAGSGSGLPKACTSWSRATGRQRGCDHPAHREVGAVHHPVGTHWIIGTTDTDWNLDLAHPAATKADIDYILDHVNTVLVTPLTPGHADGVYAGLPTAGRRERGDLQASREHAISRSPTPGLWPPPGEVHHLPGDGADAVDAAAEFVPSRGWRCRSPRRCPCWAPTATSPDQPDRQRGSAARPASVSGEAPAWTATAR